MRAHTVSTAVLDRLSETPQEAAVLGGSDQVLYLKLSSFVLALTGREAALMPNGLAAAGDLPASGRDLPRKAAVSDGRVSFGSAMLEWDPATIERWHPRPSPRIGSAVEAAEFGAALLGGLAVGPALHPDGLARAFRSVGCPLAGELAGRLAIARLLDSLLHRDPDRASRAATYLAGRGSGLTPEGDDLLTACVAAVALLGPVVHEWPGDEREAWISAVLSGVDARATTALSRTLLQLAAEGNVAQPLHPLFTAAVATPEWQAALDRLRRVGSATGEMYRLGLGASALLLALSVDSTAARGHPSKEITGC